MTIEGHYIRAYTRTMELWRRDVLEKVKENWIQARKQFWEKVIKHLSNGGRIYRTIIFDQIVRENVGQIQERLDNIDILDDNAQFAEKKNRYS